MADFLTNLFMRHQGQVEVVRPRLPGLFEPWGPGGVHTPLKGSNVPSRTQKEPPEAAPWSERGPKEALGAPAVDTAEPSSMTPAPQRAAVEWVHPDIRRPSRRETSASERGPDPEKPAVSADAPASVRTRSISATSAPGAPATRERHPGLHEQVPRDEKLTPKRGETPVVRSGDLRLEAKGEHHPAAVAPRSEALPGLERSEIPTEVATRLRQAAYRDGEPPQGGRSASAGEAAPTVRVTIGRVEVRTVEPPSRTPPRADVQKRGPSLSLDEYLKKRNSGN
jgi:hypothetical protein